MSTTKATIHLFGDLNSTRTMCGVEWKRPVKQGDCYTVEVNLFLAGRWYEKHLPPCPDCLTALEKKIESLHS